MEAPSREQPIAPGGNAGNFAGPLAMVRCGSGTVGICDFDAIGLRSSRPRVEKLPGIARQADPEAKLASIENGHGPLDASASTLAPTQLSSSNDSRSMRKRPRKSRAPVQFPTGLTTLASNLARDFHDLYIYPNINRK
jgi:hypothetical protein